MIEKDQKYDADVLAAKFTESSTGTPGIWVNFQLSDGAGAVGIKDKIIYLTSGNRDNAEKSLKAMGATAEVLAGDDFYLDPAPFLVGAKCSVMTQETEYQGKKRIEIQWINSRIKPASIGAIARARALFTNGGSLTNGEDPGYSEEVPY